MYTHLCAYVQCMIRWSTHGCSTTAATDGRIVVSIITQAPFIRSAGKLSIKRQQQTYRKRLSACCLFTAWCKWWLLSCRPSKRGLDIKASRLQESVNKASNVLAIIKDEARTESHFDWCCFMYTYARKHSVSLNSSNDLNLSRHRTRTTWELITDLNSSRQLALHLFLDPSNRSVFNWQKRRGEKKKRKREKSWNISKCHNFELCDISRFLSHGMYCFEFF